MLPDIPHFKITLKKYLGGQILYRSLVHSKKTASFPSKSNNVLVACRMIPTKFISGKFPKPVGS